MPTDDEPNAEQIRYWNTLAGETWARHQDKMDRQLSSLGQRAMDALDIRAGDRVLDIGCGNGQTSLQLAERVGASGEVTGVDISQPMLAMARKRAAACGLGGLRFEEGDAQVHPFASAAYDRIFSRFGVMFFNDPQEALVNLRRALRPGGKIGFVCWRDVSLNLFMTLPMSAAAHLLPPATPPGDPFAPGPFAFAQEARLRGLLTGAGFTDLDLTPHDEAIGGNDIADTVTMALMIGPLGAALRENPHLKDEVKLAVEAVVTPYLTERGVLMPSATWIVTATKGN